MLVNDNRFSTSLWIPLNRRHCVPKTPNFISTCYFSINLISRKSKVVDKYIEFREAPTKFSSCYLCAGFKVKQQHCVFAFAHNVYNISYRIAVCVCVFLLTYIVRFCRNNKISNTCNECSLHFKWLELGRLEFAVRGRKSFLIPIRAGEREL